MSLLKFAFLYNRKATIEVTYPTNFSITVTDALLFINMAQSVQKDTFDKIIGQRVVNIFSVYARSHKFCIPQHLWLVQECRCRHI